MELKPACGRQDSYRDESFVAIDDLRLRWTQQFRRHSRPLTGLRADGERILGRLLDMVRGRA